MVTIKQLVFNGFQVNTYLLWDETNECVIIDAANSNTSEDKKLTEIIEKELLNPVLHINTHCHVDHVLGGSFVENKFGLGVSIHPESQGFLAKAKDQAAMYGFSLDATANVSQLLKDGDKVKFGNSELEIVYTPGHAAGSICLINHECKFVITGDVLFCDSIGRTDLPTGNFDVLKHSIENKLFTLPDVYTVYPGHGPDTSIGYERINNPFL
jgi:glyoxylase-like metal-dependent hydrolase (beta-lactamase superfamily II)